MRCPLHPLATLVSPHPPPRAASGPPGVLGSSTKLPGGAPLNPRRCTGLPLPRGAQESEVRSSPRTPRRWASERSCHLGCGQVRVQLPPGGVVIKTIISSFNTAPELSGTCSEESNIHRNDGVRLIGNISEARGRRGLLLCAPREGAAPLDQEPRRQQGPRLLPSASPRAGRAPGAAVWGRPVLWACTPSPKSPQGDRSAPLYNGS